MSTLSATMAAWLAFYANAQPGDWVAPVCNHGDRSVVVGTYSDPGPVVDLSKWHFVPGVDEGIRRWVTNFIDLAHQCAAEGRGCDATPWDMPCAPECDGAACRPTSAILTRGAAS